VASQKENSNRGFAAMDEETHRQIASRGGKTAHEKGTAHEFTSEEAREAGRKGGQRKGKRHNSTDTENG
jgi:general stress protein YciG